MCSREFVWLVTKESTRFDVGHYVKLDERYLTLQTDFAARWCFWLSANDNSVEQVCPHLALVHYEKLMLIFDRN